MSIQESKPVPILTVPGAIKISTKEDLHEKSDCNVGKKVKPASKKDNIVQKSGLEEVKTASLINTGKTLNIEKYKESAHFQINLGASDDQQVVLN